MTKPTNDQPLDFGPILERLPVNFRQITVNERGDASRAAAIRLSPFEAYHSYASICYHFYKPISKII